MAQLRQDYAQFVARGTEIVVVGPEGEKSFRSYWEEHGLPFTGLADLRHTVLRTYGQEVNLYKFGRMPAQAIIDRQGIIRFVHYGKQMHDIPENQELFELLDEINGEQGEPEQHAVSANN